MQQNKTKFNLVGQLFIIFFIFGLFILPTHAIEVNTHDIRLEILGEATFYDNIYALSNATVGVSSRKLTETPEYISSVILGFAFVKSDVDCKSNAPTIGFNQFNIASYTSSSNNVFFKFFDLDYLQLGSEITTQRNQYLAPSELTHDKSRDFYCIILKVNVRLELTPDYQTHEENQVMKIYLETAKEGLFNVPFPFIPTIIALLVIIKKRKIIT